MTTSSGVVASSFRDPSGFLFWKDGMLYRRVSVIYRANYDHLMDLGLYDRPMDARLFVADEEMPTEDGASNAVYKEFRPDEIPFISYSYEGSFSQLKDAALATLEIQKRALDLGMTLKDASANNVQFTKSKPTLIHTISLERRGEGQTWPAHT